MKTTTSLTLGKAAEATGKSKTTIANACKKGRIAYTKADDGSYIIEISELQRVYPLVTPVDSKVDSTKDSQEITLDTVELRLKIKELEGELKVKEERISNLQRNYSDKEDELKRAIHDKEQFFALLPKPDNEEKPNKARRGLFSRLMGKA